MQPSQSPGRLPEAGDVVTWRSKQGLRYKARGRVDFIEGDRAKVVIGYETRGIKGASRFWKKLNELTVVEGDK